MAKKKKVKREVNADNKFEKDTVVFMTAYDIHKIKHHFFRFRKKAKKKELWTQFHMAGFSHNNTYITPYAKCRYMAEYNSLNQITAFHFEDDFENSFSSFKPSVVITFFLKLRLSSFFSIIIS